jgi:NitT/TauT family transport system permease protein
MNRNKLLSVVVPAMAIGMALGVWELLVAVNDVSSLVLPQPSAIADNVVSHMDDYAGDAWVTLQEAIAGFAVAACASIAIAAAMVHSRLVRFAVDPVQTIIRTTPVVALAPALVLWLGFGPEPKIVIAALITFPPMLVNALAGFSRVDSATLDVLRSLGASKREIFFTLRVPHALPFLISATKVCVTLALVGAVVGEWAGSSEGLGYTIVRAQSDLETATVWGATVVLAFMGLALNAIVSAAERRLLRHHPENDLQQQRGQQ